VLLFYLQQKLEKKKEKEIEKQQYETKRQREKREYIALIEERKNRQRDILNKEVYTKIRIKHYQNFVKNKNLCFLQSQNLIPLIPENLPASSCLTATKIKSAFPVPRYYSTNINTTLLIPKKIKKKDFRLVSPFKIPTLPTAFRVVYPPPKPILNPNPTFTYTSTLTQESFVENCFDEGQKIKTEPLENEEKEEIDIKVKLEIEENTNI
jgi:hypothetical protein